MVFLRHRHPHVRDMLEHSATEINRKRSLVDCEFSASRKDDAFAQR
jgi:hypothetical protein